MRFLGVITVAAAVASVAWTAAPAAGALGAAGGAPAAGATAGSVTVVAVGDIACSPTDRAFHGGMGTPKRCRMAATADLAASMAPARVLALGDLQYESATVTEFAGSYDKYWSRFDSILVPAAGNHEYGMPGARGYLTRFGTTAAPKGTTWFSTDVAGWHVVVLDGNCKLVGGCTVTSPQGRWLAEDLKVSKAACTIAMWHQPRWSSSRFGDTKSVAPLWKALYDAGADIVLSGHHHRYERFVPLDANGTSDPSTGVREFIVGTGGISLDTDFLPNPNSAARIVSYGVLRLQLNSAGYQWAFVDTSGTVRDAGTGTCHDAPG